MVGSEYLWPGRFHERLHISTRQYARIVREWVTSIGLEVESIEKVESIPGGLSGVVVGHVLTREKHPDADKLSLTTVDVGGEEPLSIVCGAPNVAAGQKGTSLSFTKVTYTL